MKRLAIAAVAAFAFVGTLAATATQTTTAGIVFIPEPPAHCTAKAFRAFSGAVWSPQQWERGKPPAKTIRAQRVRLACALPGHREVMKHRWRTDKRAFYKHRRHKLKQRREYLALTPYDCGSAGRFAIPCYVVECESGYDWGAVNESSGAFTAYQFLPSTYTGACRACDYSRLDFHYAARVVWDRSGGSEWVCA